MKTVKDHLIELEIKYEKYNKLIDSKKRIDPCDFL